MLSITSTTRAMLCSSKRVSLKARNVALLRYASTETDNGNDGQVNYYSLLNVPQTFSIQQDELKQNYRDLMTQHHPDKFRHQENAAGDAADNQDYASLVTLAYDTLKRPHTRAQHLLALETGIDMENDHQVQEHSENIMTTLPPETLMHVMELRESIDATTAPAALQSLLEENENRMQDTSLALEQAFHEKDYDNATLLTAQMQYWNRIHETIRDKMHLLS
ncbi:hypothetical protein MPSEU_000658900 [Mayamaea pseudoterrestris]|nr:hypothetical protein MPSEU_000658900 [Mayamaea pseudoterrestris]